MKKLNFTSQDRYINIQYCILKSSKKHKSPNDVNHTTKKKKKEKEKKSCRQERNKHQKQKNEHPQQEQRKTKQRF